jgi:acetyltransferase
MLQGDRIAIITNAGGPGILATDALERAGLSLARFQNETITALQQYLPDAASAANPVDVLGDARADRYRFALEKVAADPNVDGLLVLLTPGGIESKPPRISSLAQNTINRSWVVI